MLKPTLLGGNDTSYEHMVKDKILNVLWNE